MMMMMLSIRMVMMMLKLMVMMLLVKMMMGMVAKLTIVQLQRENVWRNFNPSSFLPLMTQIRNNILLFYLQGRDQKKMVLCSTYLRPYLPYPWYFFLLYKRVQDKANVAQTIAKPTKMIASKTKLIAKKYFLILQKLVFHLCKVYFCFSLPGIRIF